MGATVGSVARGGAQSVDDPRTAPVPTIESPGQEKIFVVQVVFVGQDVVSSSVEVAYGTARTQVGAPPLYRVRLEDGGGQVLREFNLWPPNLARAEPEGDGNEFHVLPQATGRVAFAFDAELALMELIDLQRPGAPVVTAVDLAPATQAFCQRNPHDSDCQRVTQPTTGTSVPTPGTTTIMEEPGNGAGVTTTRGMAATPGGGSSGGASTGTASAGSGAAASSSRGGMLAFTGTEALRMVAVAAWLVALGSFLLLWRQRAR